MGGGLVCAREGPHLLLVLVVVGPIAMKRLICLISACVCLSAATAGAAVIERDWKVPGDGLLTYDTVNHREWLDVPLSLLSQFPGTLEEKYQAAVSETAPGGDFEGFTPAKLADVIALAQSAGIDTGTLDYSTNLTATNKLMGLLGNTYTLGDRRYTMGFLSKLSTNPHWPMDRLVSIFQDNSVQQQAGGSVSTLSATELIGSARAGVMFYREAVPDAVRLGTSMPRIGGCTGGLPPAKKALTTTRSRFVRLRAFQKGLSHAQVSTQSLLQCKNVCSSTVADRAL